MGQKLSAAADALLKESWQQEDEAEEESAKSEQADGSLLARHDAIPASRKATHLHPSPMMSTAV